MAIARRFFFLDLFNGMRMLGFVSFVFGISTFIICGWIFLSNHLHIQSKLFTNSIVLTPKFISTKRLQQNSIPNNSNNNAQNNLELPLFIPCIPNSTTTTTGSTSFNNNSSSGFNNIPTIDDHDQNENFHNYEVFDSLRDSIIRCCIMVVILSLVQVISAAYIIGSPVQGCHGRVKLWFMINCGLNIAILICLTMPLMYQVEHSSHLQQIRLDDSNLIPSPIILPLLNHNNNNNDTDLPICATVTATTNEPATINHLNAYYIGLGTNFGVQFFTLIFCLLLLRFNRHYSNNNDNNINYEQITEYM